MSVKYRTDWNYGNAVHDGNRVLGILSMKDGDITRAKLYLLNAGKTSGSPQLSSFCPELKLAHDLLERGETVVVIQYLEMRKLFWKKGRSRIDSWIISIQGGGKPYFCDNITI